MSTEPRNKTTSNQGQTRNHNNCFNNETEFSVGAIMITNKMQHTY